MLLLSPHEISVGASSNSLNQFLFMYQRNPKADPLFPWDECLNGPGEYGPCDPSKFPVCDEDHFICYNRRPRQDKFYSDTRQPVFFIDYKNVFCYPNSWGGCSSCSPGRLCVSQQRCIMDEQSFPCDQWI